MWFLVLVLAQPGPGGQRCELVGAPPVGPTNPSQSPAPQPATVDLQVIKRNGAALVIAPIVINGKTYAFVVDTGATATLIDSSYAKALGLKKTKQAPIPVMGVTGSGSAYLATISNWKIGRAKIPTSTITVSTIHLGVGLVGLLGSDVLSTFGKVRSTQRAEGITRVGCGPARRPPDGQDPGASPPAGGQPEVLLTDAS